MLRSGPVDPLKGKVLSGSTRDGTVLVKDVDVSFCEKPLPGSGVDHSKDPAVVDPAAWEVVAGISISRALRNLLNQGYTPRKHAANKQLLGKAGDADQTTPKHHSATSSPPLPIGPPSSDDVEDSPAQREVKDSPASTVLSAPLDPAGAVSDGETAATQASALPLHATTPILNTSSTSHAAAAEAAGSPIPSSINKIQTASSPRPSKTKKFFKKVKAAAAAFLEHYNEGMSETSYCVASSSAMLALWPCPLPDAACASMYPHLRYNPYDPYNYARDYHY
jgi:hypothetical protein